MKTRLLLLTALAVSSSAFAAGTVIAPPVPKPITLPNPVGNGSGYNGPDLHPISIPVQLERGISLKSVQAAISTCMVTGDAKSGLQSLAQKLAAEMGEAVCKGLSIDKETQVGTSPNNTIDFAQQVNFCSVSEANTINLHLSAWNSDQNGNRINVSGLGLNFIYGRHRELYMSTPEDKVLFPYIAFEKIVKDGQYDDFGNLVDGTVLVSGLKIEAAIDSTHSLAALPLINYNTHKVSKFTVNAEEYMQCLQSELQKHATDGAEK